MRVGNWLIDATASQFNESNELQLDELVITPLSEALAGPWQRSPSWADDSWNTGEINRLMGEWPAGLGPAPRN